MRWPVSRVLSRTAGMVIHLGRRLPDASCGRPEGGATRPCAARATRALLFGLAPGRACPFHPAGPKPRPTRLCGAGPRLAADGSYPLPCVVVLGLSSGDGLPRHTRPSSHLTGRWTLAPAVGWHVQRRCDPARSLARLGQARYLASSSAAAAGSSRARLASASAALLVARGSWVAFQRSKPASSSLASAHKHAHLGVLDPPAAVQLLHDELGVEAQVDLARAQALRPP